MGEAKRRKTVGGSHSIAADIKCVPVTLEQFQFASAVAWAVKTGKTPRETFESKHKDALDRGEIDPSKRYWRLTDAIENHMAFAIMDAFPEKTDDAEQIRQALLWRVMFVAPQVFSDARSSKYVKHTEEGEMAGWPLLEACAQAPMNVGQEIPIASIFAMADELAAKSNWPD